MSKRGEIMGIALGGAKRFAMVPWMPGIWEFQINRMDREFCELWEEYARHFDRSSSPRTRTPHRSFPSANR